MFYEVTCKRVEINERGNDKEVKERFIVDNAIFFAEAECKVLDYYNNQCEVIAIKQSTIKEFVNESNDGDDIYLSTIVTILVEENGNEKEQKYVVGVFANSVEDATKKTYEYMKQGLDDFILVGVKKTNFLEVL